MRKINVGIDMHAVGENLSGNEVYIKNVAKYLLKIKSDIMNFTLFFNEQNDLEYFENFSNTEAGKDFDYYILNSHSSLNRLFKIFPRILRTKHFDIMHFQYVLPWPTVKGISYVNTIHDCSFKRFPEHYTIKQNMGFKLIDKSIKKSDEIITVSNFSKDEVLRYYPYLNSEQVTVIYNGIDTDKFRIIPQLHINKQIDKLEKRRNIKIPDKFLLTVGNLQPRKNIIRLLKAFSMVKKINNDIKLIIVGQKAWKYDDIFREADNAINENIIFTGYINDEELIALYNKAYLFIYPSLYEGFGLPVLEAIHCGCPILTSDTSSLREICPIKDALFDPYDIQSIFDKIRLYLSNETKRNELLYKENKLVGRFSWETSAHQHMKVYENLIK